MFNQTTRAVAGFLTRYDVLLTPTTSAPPIPLGHLDADDASLSAREWYDRIFDYGSFTALFNCRSASSSPAATATKPRCWRWPAISSAPCRGRTVARPCTWAGSAPCGSAPRAGPAHRGLR
ncbi:amidase [Mycobacteroides abscessus subsp. abscessus]|nr:amidase [Mycobacteroides abscessus subsp. abscessus]